MKRMMILLAALLALSPWTAQANGKTTFSGSCHFSASVRFQPPLTTMTQPGSAFARGTGTCNARPAGYVAWASGPGSCSEGSAHGAGYLVLGRRKLRFSLEEARVSGAAVLRFQGRRGGSAEGNARVTGDPAEIAQQCIGSGLRETTVDIDLATTPSLSG